MKCFHFTNGDRRASGDVDVVVARSSARVSWARSLSIASSSVDSTRRSEFDGRDFCDSVGFMEMLSQRRANDLRVFKFSELKSATKGFNRGLMIGEGGFGCVYRGVVNGGDNDDEIDRNGCLDVAIKQLNRNGFQACPFPSLFLQIFI